MEKRYCSLLSLFLVFCVQPGFGQWVETSGTIASSFHNTAVAWEGKVYFTGGPVTQAVTIANYNKKLEILDLETGMITTGPESQSPGRCAIGGIAFNGKIYFAGGHRWIATTPGLQLYDQLDIFDVATQTWEYQHLPTAKTWFAIAVVNGKIMFAGGYVKVGSQILPTDVVDIYDPANDNWSVQHLSQPRGELAAGVVGNKVWFCGGGQSWTSWQASSRVDAYDADLDEWTNTELTAARASPAVAVAGNYLICAGGYTNTEGNSAKVDLLNIPAGTWSTTVLSAPRFGISAATLGTKAYFTGGGHLNLAANYYNTSSSKVDVFDAADGTWSTSNLNKNRMTHSCVAWGNKIVVGGGWRPEQTQTTGSIEILTDPSVVSAPTALTGHSDIALFPNPAGDVLYMTVPETNHPVVIRMVDVMGRAVLQQSFVTTTISPITLDLSQLPDGLYWLECSTGSRHFEVRNPVLIRH